MTPLLIAVGIWSHLILAFVFFLSSRLHSLHWTCLAATFLASFGVTWFWVELLI